MTDDKQKKFTPAQKRLTEEQGLRMINPDTPEGQAELKAMDEQAKARIQRIRERKAKRDAEQSKED